MSKNQAQGIFRLLALLYILNNLIHLCNAVVSYWRGTNLYKGVDWLMSGEGKELFYHALTNYGVSIFCAAMVMIYSAELAGLVVRAYSQPDSQENELHA